jgi:membrane fusion protein (multidrug efflux system)
MQMTEIAGTSGSRLGWAAACLLAGLAGLALACSNDVPEQGPGGHGPGGREITPVVTTRPAVRALEDTFLEREASLLPVAEATISTRQDGFVRSVAPEVGDMLHEGDLIAELDHSDSRLRIEGLRATVKKAEVDLEVKRRQWARLLQLYESKVISEDQRDEQRGELERAAAEVDEERAKLEREQQYAVDLTIRSPMPGIVARIHTEAGEYLKRGDPILELKRIDAIVALCTVNERFLGDVAEGSPVRVYVTAHGDRAFDGLVWKVVGDALVESRSFPVKILLPNRDFALKPGMSARVAFSRRLDQALLVPKDAVVVEGDERVVYLVRDGHAERRPVEVGAEIEDLWHVRRGLAPDDLVVVTGNAGLNPGDVVKIVELPPPSTSPGPTPLEAERPAAAGS